MKTKKFIRNNPHLPVKNLRETLNYYRDILGFYDEWTRPGKNGEIKDGGIRRDDMRLLFGEDPDFTIAVNRQGKRLPLLWFVENIDEIFFEDVELRKIIKECMSKSLKISEEVEQEARGRLPEGDSRN